jgi:phosphohistidine phosphatase
MSVRLIVMRHGKAVASAATDHARPLAPRGRADSADAGRWIAREGYVPDLALVSSATRTRQTWDSVAAAIGGGIPVDVRDDLYGAGPESVLETVRLVPDEVGTAIVVGHNPTALWLAHALDDGESAEDRDLVERGFPTSALAVFAFDDDWASVGWQRGRLVAMHLGRG